MTHSSGAFLTRLTGIVAASYSARARPDKGKRVALNAAEGWIIPRPRMNLLVTF